MANEITINLPSITYIKGVYNDSLAVGIVNETVTGSHSVHDAATLSTTPAALPKGAIGTIGFFFMRNKDATANAQFSVGTTDYQSLPPGGIAIGYANSSAINAKCVSGTPTLEYWLIEA
jgi:hypothetical protein